MKTLRQKHPKQTGFTLIELMVTVAILAILVAIGVPAMNDFLNSNRHTAHTNALKQAIQYARSEAVAKNQNVSICASSDGASCTGNWNQGWIVRIASNGTVLRVWNSLSDSSTINGGVTTTFSSTGEKTPTGVSTFTIADPSGSRTSNLSVNNVGWVTVSKSYSSGSSGGSGGSGGDSGSGGGATGGGS